jgi:hypothetical protein
MNEDVAALFRDTYACLALKARPLLPCVLCGVTPRVHLVVDDKLERVIELVVTCVVVPVVPLPPRGRPRRRRRRNRHRKGVEEQEEEEGGEEAALPPLVASPPSLLPSGLFERGALHPGEAYAHGGATADPIFAVTTGTQWQQQQSPLVLPLMTTATAAAAAATEPPTHPSAATTTTTSSSSSSSSSLIGRVASLTRTGSQTLLRRGQRALQLASAPLFSASSSSSSSARGHQHQQQHALESALLLDSMTPATAAAGGAAAVAAGGTAVVDPRSLVELTPLASVPNARVVRYLGACVHVY